MSAEDVASSADMAEPAHTADAVRCASTGSQGQPCEDADRSVHYRADRGQVGREGGVGARRLVGRLAGQRRHRRRDQGHAGRDGVVQEGDVSGCRPGVEDVRQDVLRRRKPGLAQIAKLANNLLAAAAIVLSSEAVAMGVKAGLERRRSRHHQRRQRTQQRDARQVSQVGDPAHVRLRLLDRAVIQGRALCLDEAEALGVPMVAGAAVQMLAITNAKFGPDSDFTSIARAVEEGWSEIK